jgi:hypothetical protein
MICRQDAGCLFAPQPAVHILHQARGCHVAKLLTIHDAITDFLVAFRAVDEGTLQHVIHSMFEITDSIDLSCYPEDFILNNNQVRTEYKSPLLQYLFRVRTTRIARRPFVQYYGFVCRIGIPLLWQASKPKFFQIDI